MNPEPKANLVLIDSKVRQLHRRRRSLQTRARLFGLSKTEDIELRLMLAEIDRLEMLEAKLIGGI